MPGDLEGDRPRLTEHELDWHLAYANTFNDPEVRQKAVRWRDKFERKGVFSALYELASEPDPEPTQPTPIEFPDEEVTPSQT